MAAPVVFKIRCSLAGHSKDVRALHPVHFPENAFVSGSRDVTARLWAPLDDTIGYQEAHCMSGHNNFISCICVAAPSEKYPQGLILTGSNDTTILAFTLESPKPVFTLDGHTSTVCSLSVGKFGTIVSGSWDKTARVWLHEKTVMTLQGHEAAVWAVAVMPEQGLMITGSADKTVKMWKAGKCEKTLKGHTDCVRGLAVLSADEFLSCANDATVRRWLTSGSCVQVYYGHENYIYSIAVLPNGRDFVTTGEDRTLRVWLDGECRQTISHPAQSIWAVCALANGDIVTGASDGVVRVFSADPVRQAPDDEQAMFTEEVAQSQIPTQVGDLKTEELPGPEVLLAPGARDGQTKLVRTGTRVECHQWSAVEQKWTMVGDVVGATGASQATSGKTLFDGEEYDYVFSVDIEEGKPPLKLPYNTSEDPWFAAQRFLHKHQLPQAFLDQVAEFIQENTKGVTLSTGQAVSDPFTGEGRYVPGSSTEASGSMVDPFTGGGRYVPGTADPRPTNGHRGPADPFTGASSYQSEMMETGSPAPPSKIKYFPKTTFLTFEAGKQEAILAKLAEFNEKVPSDVRIENVDELTSLIAGSSVTKRVMEKLWTALLWPAEYRFPALDAARLSIRHQPINDHFCRDVTQFFPHLIQSLTTDSPGANQMLALRIICNAFNQPEGAKMLISIRENVINSALLLQNSTNKNVQIALASLLLNYSIALTQTDLESRSHCAIAAITILETAKDTEALFRLFVTIGTLSTDPETRELCKSMNLAGVLQEYSKRNDIEGKVSGCAACLLEVLK